MDNKMILVPLNLNEVEGKEPFLIWEKHEGEKDTFRMPSNAELNMPVAFWLAEQGVVAFGKVVSAVFDKDEKTDRNDKKKVAEVEFTEIFCDNPIKTKELTSQVSQVPVYIFSEELMRRYLHK